MVVLCPSMCLQGDRLEEDWVPLQDERPQEEIEKEARAAEAKNRYGHF